MSLCGTNEQLKIELISQWKLEAEFHKRKILETETKILGVEITNTERQQDKYILTHPKNMYETV